MADRKVKGTGVPPKSTRVTPMKPAPVRVTAVPPLSGPAVVDSEATAGRLPGSRNGRECRGRGATRGGDAGRPRLGHDAPRHQPGRRRRHGRRTRHDAGWHLGCDDARSLRLPGNRSGRDLAVDHRRPAQRRHPRHRDRGRLRRRDPGEPRWHAHPLHRAVCHDHRGHDTRPHRRARRPHRHDPVRHVARRARRAPSRSIPSRSIASVSPQTGPPSGGTVVTVTGTGLTRATTIRFGTVTATNLVRVSDTTLRVTTPAHASGTGRRARHHPGRHVRRRRGSTVCLRLAARRHRAVRDRRATDRRHGRDDLRHRPRRGHRGAVRLCRRAPVSSGCPTARCASPRRPRPRAPSRSVS